MGTIEIHILSNISRNKDNHIMKFGLLIEDKMRVIFLEKLHTKYSGETIPRSLDQQSKVL